MNATTRFAFIIATLIVCTVSQGADDRAAKWREDLVALKTELPNRHVNAFTKTTRADFDKSIEELASRVEALADHEIVVEMQRIVASIGDAHTIIGFNKFTNDFFPLGIYLFKDGPFVAVAEASQREVLGAKVVGIGSMGFDDASKRVEAVFPWENESHRKLNLPRWMTNAQVLHALKVIESPERATFKLQLADGSTKSVELKPIAIGSKPNLVRAPDWSKLQRPISMTPHSTKYWFEFDDASNAIYVRYDACVNDPKYPFDKFKEDVLAAIEEKKPAKLIFDLRNNGGGDSRIAEPLINAIRDNKSINQRGKLFVLIARATFSSAQMNAQHFRDRTNATLIGEPTGQKPNHFGEIKSFTLPNSGISVQYSTKQFRMSKNDEPSMMPDDVIEPTSAEFFAGRDVVMEHLAPLPRREGRGAG